ncbi:jg3733 [Pararge aegeria aegeria]|uniref:Jg3733 protein n=1 Tax=Pararge aegeria aegeria TaxID=348720 RepID=A0A8S4QUQ0_9NEOP|nr:jg3733 [Pararge aegeria aegeria]
MMRRGKALLEGSRQGSVDGNSNLASDKELVHKCHSDPGGGRALGADPRTQRHRSVSGALRKCVLTLDGYSYVIGHKSPLRRSSDVLGDYGEFSGVQVFYQFSFNVKASEI